MRLKIIGTMGITVAISTRAGPIVSTKKVLMKEGVSSLDTKKCVYLKMIQKWHKMVIQKKIYGGCYRPITKGPSGGRLRKILRWMIGL